MKNFRVEITGKVLIRINRYLPRPIPKEWVPNCFGEPTLSSGYCNRDELLPGPTENIPKPIRCACRRPCLITLAEQLDIPHAEEMVSMKDDDGEPKKLFELCKSKFAAFISSEQPALTPEQPEALETLAESQEQPKTPPQASPEPPEPSSEPVEGGTPSEAPVQTQEYVEFKCQKCDSIFKVIPQAFDGELFCDLHRQPAPTSSPIPQSPPPEDPVLQDPPVESAAIDNPPKVDPAPAQPSFTEKKIPFRRSSAAWKMWGILTEALTPDELEAKMRAGNYDYLKKQMPQVLAKAKEMGVLTEYDTGGVHIVGSWDTELGAKAKKTAAKKEKK